MVVTAPNTDNRHGVVGLNPPISLVPFCIAPGHNLLRIHQRRVPEERMQELVSATNAFIDTYFIFATTNGKVGVNAFSTNNITRFRGAPNVIRQFKECWSLDNKWLYKLQGGVMKKVVVVCDPSLGGEGDCVTILALFLVQSDKADTEDKDVNEVKIEKVCLPDGCKHNSRDVEVQLLLRRYLALVLKTMLPKLQNQWSKLHKTFVSLLVTKQVDGLPSIVNDRFTNEGKFTTGPCSSDLTALKEFTLPHFKELERCIQRRFSNLVGEVTSKDLTRKTLGFVLT